MNGRRLRRGLDYLRPTSLPGVLRRAIDRHRLPRRREWWMSQRHRADFIVAEIAPGLRMQLYFDDELSWLIYAEHFEWQERQFVRSFLRPGDVFVDVGANIGLFTLAAATCVGPAGRVVSVEPCTATFQRLQANVRLNALTNVTCVRLALSDANAQAPLTSYPAPHAAWNSFSPAPASATEMVSCATWDAYAQAHDLVGRVALMKIDVEGWEARVLRGGSGALARPDAPVLIVEFVDTTAHAAGSSCAKLYQMLQDLGYRMYAYDGLRREIRPHPVRTRYEYVNLIALKHVDAVATRLDRRHRWR